MEQRALDERALEQQPLEEQKRWSSERVGGLIFEQRDSTAFSLAAVCHAIGTCHAAWYSQVSLYGKSKTLPK